MPIFKKGFRRHEPAFSDVKALDSMHRFQVVLEFWRRLSRVKQIAFHVKSSAVHWKGTGEGEVTVQAQEKSLIFQEKGFWVSQEGKQVGFRNVLRWTLDKGAGFITLEHLRRGIEHPVFLFHLAPTSKNYLASVDPHCCGDDTYFGCLFCDTDCLRLNWRIIGLRKNEEIESYYS